jgi:hypothetical protein
MRPGDDVRRPARAAVGVPAVFAGGLLVVVAAATAPSWSVTDRFGVWGGTPSYAPRTPPPLPLPSGEETPPPLEGSGVGTWTLPVLWVLLALAVVALAFWIWRVLPRPAVKAPAEEPTGGPAVGGSADAPAVRQGVSDAQQLLDTILDPTDAVLAAWVALEDAAARSGLPRHPADTPTEFTARVLTATEADAEAVTRLLGLYHRARFSAGGVSPDAVTEARRCLAALAASWSRFSTAPGPRP